MQSKIVLTEVARARADDADLRSAADGHAHTRSDGVARDSRKGANQQGVSADAVIAEQIGGLAVVGHEHIEIAVVVDVAGRQSAAHFFEREAVAGAAPDLDETPRACVAEQEIPLRIGGTCAVHRGVVHDVAVDDRDVELHVVVRVQEGDPEADVSECGEPEAARARGVLEQSSAQIPKQTVSLEVEVGDHEILPKIAIVIAGIDTHARPGLAVGRNGDARRERGFDKTISFDTANVQELTFTLSGALGESETGGASITVVPRTGGNRFAGSYFTSYLDDSFFDRNRGTRLSNTPATQDVVKDFEVNGGSAAR